MSWVNSDDLQAWVAEIGPYTGPWPPAPPVPDNLPPADQVTELDYLITLDDLDTVLANAADGVTVARLYTDGVSGPGDTRSVLASAPPSIDGGILYVIAYPLDYAWPGAAPAGGAESFVPPLYAAAGAGADLPDPAGGRWSTTQPGEGLFSAPAIREFSGQYIADTPRIPGDVNVHDETQNQLLSLRAWPTAGGSPWSEGAFGIAIPYNYFFFEAVKEWLGIPPALKHEAAVSTNQSAAIYTADPPSLPSLPEAVTTGLIEGLDYTAPPDDLPGGNLVEYDGVGVSWVGWEDLVADFDFTIDRYLHPGGPLPSGGTVDASKGQVRFAAVADPETVIAGPPFSYDMGTTLAVVGGAGQGTITETVTLPLSSLGGGFPPGVLALVPLSSFLDPDITPVSDFDAPASPDDPGNDGIAGVNGYVWQISAVPVPTRAPAPVAQYATPTYRYWDPNGPVLKTVGENFRSAGGPRVRSLIPRHGWVPVRRHG